MRLIDMRFEPRGRHSAAPVLAMVLVIAACGGGAAGGEGSAGVPTDVAGMATTEVPAADSTTQQPPETEDAEAVTSIPPTGEAGDEPAETATSPTTAGPLDARVAFAMNDLATRMAVSLEDITLVSREDVTWRDGSLGCPQPGMFYTQALVDGYKITLEIDGETYAYHGQGGRDPFLCETNLAAEKSTTTIFLEPKEDGAADELQDDSSLDD